MRVLPSSPVILAAIVLAGCADPASGPANRRAPGSQANAAKPPSNNINVTTTVYDTDLGGNPLVTQSDDKNGAGFATYSASDGLTSQIGGNGAWSLYIGSQKVRTLYLSLSSAGIPVPDGKYWENVQAFSQCFDQNGNAVGILGLAAGTSNGNCTFGLDFTSARTKYQLKMGPMDVGTGRALVSCLAASGGSCTSWTIVPDPDAPNAGVANLYTFNNRGQLVPAGVFSNSFRISVGP